MTEKPRVFHRPEELHQQVYDRPVRFQVTENGTLLLWGKNDELISGYAYGEWRRFET